MIQGTFVSAQVKFKIHYAFDLTVSKDGERENLSLTLLNIESDIGDR